MGEAAFGILKGRAGVDPDRGAAGRALRAGALRLAPAAATNLAALRMQASEAPARPDDGRWQYRNVAIAWEPAFDVWRDPSRRDELDGILARGAGARVLSTCWAMSRIAHPREGGGVVLARPPLAKCGALASYDPTTRTVVCRIGATFHDVFGALEGTGRALANQPGFAHLSVAGSIGTGGHGSGLALGPMAELVEAVTIGAPRAGAEPVALRRGDPDFAASVLHLGRLGPVLELRLATVEAFHVAESRTVLSLGGRGRDWSRALRGLVRDVVDLQRREPERVHSVELWVAPYAIDGVLTVALGIRERTRAPLSPPHVRRPAALRERSIVAMGESVALLLSDQRLRGATPWVLREAVHAVATTPPVVMTSTEGLDFGAPNEARMGAVEAAVPVAVGADAVVATIELLGALASGPDETYVLAPMGVRFVGPAPGSSLSPHAGRDGTLHVEVPTFGADDVFHGDRVLAPVQRMLARRFAGRPHWGQRIYLAPDELRALWPAASVRSMAELVRRRDPGGDLASPLLDAVLGI